MRLPTLSVILNHFFRKQPKVGASHYPLPANYEILLWRERAFSTVFITLMVISAVIYIPPLITALEAGLWWVGVNYIVFLTVIFFLVYFRSVRFKVRAGLGVLLLLGIGWSTLHMSGLFGSGRLWFFLCPIIAGMFLGLKAGLSTLALNACIIFYYAVWGEKYDLVWDSLALDTNHFKAWAITGSTFVLLCFVAVITVVSLLKFLEKSLKLSKSLQDSLEAEQGRLKEYNRLLEGQRAETQQYIDLAGIMLTVDSNCRIRMANNGFCALVGKTEREVMGLDLFECFGSPENREKSKKALLGFLLEGDTQYEYFEAGLINSDGLEKLIEWHCRFFDIGQDKKPGVLLYGEDITIRREAERDRLEQERLIIAIQTAGAVCHEMNQPLQSLMWNTEIMAKRPGAELNERRVQILMNEIDRMAQITSKLQKITSYQTRDYVDGAKILDIDKSSE